MDEDHEIFLHPFVSVCERAPLAGSQLAVSPACTGASVCAGAVGKSFRYCCRGWHWGMDLALSTGTLSRGVPGNAERRLRMSVERSRPEDFLELVERAKRGRLKIYIGAAAGVGKTYQMLEEAHVLKKRGVDVVLAFIETHGRAETAALIAGLEVILRRRFEYRGVMVEEMDLDAVLARRPQVAVVDELPHTNVPGSRNKKRYQDVLELLDAGINVICAMNVQHLESLNDLVRQATDVIVRETVPDSFLKQADQVVNLDLAAEDLLERLRAGKIYSAEKISWALEHFFKPENLSTLREIALREVAENIDRSAAAAHIAAD